MSGRTCSYSPGPCWSQIVNGKYPHHTDFPSPEPGLQRHVGGGGREAFPSYKGVLGEAFIPPLPLLPEE